MDLLHVCGRGCLGSRTRCVCMQMDCVQTQISVNKKTKQKKLTGEKGWWAERADLLHVCVDADRGRGCLGSRTHCVCMQMDCVRTQMSVKKKLTCRLGKVAMPGTQVCCMCRCIAWRCG